MIEALLLCAMLTVVDGDTVRCWNEGDDSRGQLLRLLGDGAPYVDGVDAPETVHRECVAELMLGRLATARLRELIEIPGITIEDSGQVDPRGRPLVRIRMPNGQTAGRILMDEGYAGPWTAEAGQVDWCGPIPPAE